MSNQFATTQWKVVLEARDGTESQARAALEALCRAYWFPLYAYVRSRGYDADRAADLTQAFFADLLGRNFLNAIDRSKGRFRSFLLASLGHFLSHEREKATALKHGGGVPPMSLDTADAEVRYRLEPADTVTPDLVFERRWGLTVMERTMERLRVEFDDETGRFDQLKACLTGDHPERYADIAATLGTTPAAVKAAVHRLRQRYGRLLREEIADTVTSPTEVDEELRHLLGVVRPWQDRPV